MPYTIIQASEKSKLGYQGRGAAKELWYCKAPEVIISGPYETGKTLAALHKLHTLLAKYPNARALMVRKTYKSMIASTVVTLETKVLPFPPGHPRCGVIAYGGERPTHYHYKQSGSVLYLGGMDNADKFLSAEFDFIYINQAEELSLGDWEKLVGRATGRAGNTPYAQVIGDCNPDTPMHWILKRGAITLLKSTHKDNPVLWDGTDWTDQGKRTMSALKSLTGTRYKRGFLGLWAGAEGQVYEGFDTTVHIIDRFDIPEDWPRYRAIDFGYTNPFVCQWWAVDPDGRLYLYREIYRTGRTVREHAELINSYPEPIVATVADHDAEDRATLKENGIFTQAADKRVSVGLDKVAERLKIVNGKPRLFIMRDTLGGGADTSLKKQHKPVCTADEFGGYVWPSERANRARDEKPVKVDDHGLDALRYMVMYFDGKKRLKTWGW